MKSLVPVNEDLREMMRALKSSGGLFETAEQEAEYDRLIAEDLESASNAVIDAERRYDRIKKASKEALDYLKMVSEDLRERISKQASQMPVNGKGKWGYTARLFSAHLAKSKGRVELIEGAAIPRMYIKVVTEEKADMELLRVGLEAGEPGAMACARLVGADDKHIVLRVNEAAVRELEVQAEIKAALE